MTTEADQLFAEQVAKWRRESWANLRSHLKDPVAYEIVGTSGIVYQFEAEVFWDNRKESNLRVIITSDDGRGDGGSGGCAPRALSRHQMEVSWVSSSSVFFQRILPADVLLNEQLLARSGRWATPGLTKDFHPIRSSGVLLS